MTSRRERRGKKKKSEKVEVIEEAPVEKKKVEKKNLIRRIYEDNYKVLLIIPFAMLICAIIVIGMQIAQTGDFVDKDVTLKGGLTITVLTSQGISFEDLEVELRTEFPDSDIRVREISEFGSQTGLIIDASDADPDTLLSYLGTRINNFENSYSVESIGPALGNNFFKQTMKAIVFAFILMAIVVFIYFRTLIPSAAVVLAALSDIIVTIGIMNLIGMKLSTAGIAALLMLIGYSVDTDILLSTRVLKSKEGSIMKRVYSAVKTGLTMNATTLVAIIVALVVSQSETITQIMSILLIGLIVDIINTWIQNVGILRMYVEAKE